MKTMESAQVTGRAWIYDDEPSEIEVFEYAFVPMELGRRSGEEWCREYLVESCSNKLREVFGLPESGNFQVIFKGKMIGYTTASYDIYDYDEEFELEESRHEPIPQSYMEKP